MCFPGGHIPFWGTRYLTFPYTLVPPIVHPKTPENVFPAVCQWSPPLTGVFQTNVTFLKQDVARFV